jgi:hypothetical protein
MGCLDKGVYFKREELLEDWNPPKIALGVGGKF